MVYKQHDVKSLGSFKPNGMDKYSWWKTSCGHQLRLVVSQIIDEVFYILGGAVFLPPTVWRNTPKRIQPIPWYVDSHKFSMIWNIRDVSIDTTMEWDNHGLGKKIRDHFDHVM